MAVLFALISSLSWGTADFLGGLASRRVGSLRVLSVSYPAGGVLITILALLVVPGVLSSESVWVGVTSGAVGAVGMGLLYAALAQGQMGIVSPITAVLSGAVPVLVGVQQVVELPRFGSGRTLLPTSLTALLAGDGQRDPIWPCRLVILRSHDPESAQDVTIRQRLLDVSDALHQLRLSLCFDWRKPSFLGRSRLLGIGIGIVLSRIGG